MYINRSAFVFLCFTVIIPIELIVSLREAYGYYRVERSGWPSSSSHHFQHLPPSYTFEWQHADYSECSVTCGEGQEVSEAICRDYKTGKRVRDVYCEEVEKPKVNVRSCRLSKCHPVWVTGDWSECNVVCGGGGVSRRIVYCAEEVHEGSYQRTLHRLCRGDKPETNRTCNQVDCPQWYAGQWSECSKSCGVGVQERAVVCRRTESLDCIEDMKPVSERICHQKPCNQKQPYYQKGDADVKNRKNGNKVETSSSLNGREASDMKEYIDIFNYRRIHSRGSETFRAESGGNVVIIDDPNRDYVREFGGLGGPSSTTAPTIGGEPDQAGSGDFDEREDKRVRLLGTNISSFRETTTVLLDSLSWEGSGDITEALGLHSHLFDSTIQSKDPYLDYYSVLQLEPLLELSLVAPQKTLSVTLLHGTDLRIYCTGADSRSSTWTRKDGTVLSKSTLSIRNDDLIQHNPGVYLCQRGGGGEEESVDVTVKLVSPSSDEMEEMKMLRRNYTIDTQQIKALTRINNQAESTTHLVEYFFDGIIVPDRTVLDTIPLSLIATEWSQCPCSERNGKFLLQTRNVTCEVVTERFAVQIDMSFCRRRTNLKSLVTERDCAHNCYRWTVGNWNQCSGESCTSVGYGTRNRSVKCVTVSNGMETNPMKCESRMKPETDEACEHAMCQGVWQALPWSQCSVSCGKKGIKTRKLRCAWMTDASVALDEAICSDQPKPANRKFCFNPPCSNSYCRDESFYCSNVPVFGLCHLQQYRNKCCHSCAKQPRWYPRKRN